MKELLQLLLRRTTFATLKKPARERVEELAREHGVDIEAERAAWDAECIAIIDADTARTLAERARLAEETTK